MQFQYGDSRTTELIRQTSLKLRDVEYHSDAITVDNALAYFERQNDTAYVKEKYKDRAAIGIRKKAGTATYETYVKGRAAEQIDNGELEVVTVGLGPRIINARATLFTNKTQSWDYVTGEGKVQAKDEDTAKLIAEQRRLGSFDIEVSDADYIASGIETGPLYVDWMGGHLIYRSFSPNCFFAKFSDTVIDNGIERGVDYLNIEDAACIVILLSTKKDSNEGSKHVNQYIAYYGRSDEYPLGRRVQYQASDWRKIPEVDTDKDAIEYRLNSGEVANPLSYMAAQKASKGIVVPEYPVCLFRGGLTKTQDTLVPISTSLYESCMEVDIAMSKLLKAGLTSALGKDVVTNELGYEVPRLLEGAILLRKGQTLSIMGQPVSNAQGAMEITKDMMRSIAEGYGVPGYMVIEQPGGNPESGIALMVRTAPLIEEREKRIKQNKSIVDRLWQIERNLYEFVMNSPLGSEDTRQIWNPGRYVVPESELEKVQRLTQAMEKGFIDYVRAVRDFNDLPTDQDAIDFIEKMRDEERTQYQAPTATGAQRTGIPLGLSARLQQRPGQDNQVNQENQPVQQQGGREPPNRPG